jgi:ketosteroid isomerase-like protein
MAVNCEKVVNDLFAAWTRLNLDEVMVYFADDAVWDNVPLTPPKAARPSAR